MWASEWGPAEDNWSTPWNTLALTLCATAMFGLAGAVPEQLVFDRHSIAAGELWRLFSAHWVHCDLQHALWNIAALAVLGCVFEARLGWRLPAALVAGMVAIDAWLWWGMPELARYCGLSGILNSLLAVALIQLWRDTRDPMVLLAAAGAVAKIVVESVTGTPVFTHTTWPSVPSVHAVGLIAGAVLAIRPKSKSLGLPAHPSRGIRSAGRQLRQIGAGFGQISG